jgi:membrane protein
MAKSVFLQFFYYLNFHSITKTVKNVMERRLLGLASEIAFNAMLSLFPAILAILTAIGLFEESLQETFKEWTLQFSQVAPVEVLNLISEFATKEIASSKNSSLFSLSFVIAIWTASGAVSTAMTALDQIHQIPKNKIRPFWQAKIISLALTIGSILLLLLACFLAFISDFLLHFLLGNNKSWNSVLQVWQMLRWFLALGLISLANAFLYCFGPSHRDRRWPMMAGAILAALFWAILSALFRLYVSNFAHYNKAYGAVGTIIILMLWLYLTAVVFLVGDQLNVSVGEYINKSKYKIQ